LASFTTMGLTDHLSKRAFDVLASQWAFTHAHEYATPARTFAR